MPRFFLPPENWHDEPALEDEEAKHLAQVLRMQPGETITVFDGRGNRAEAQILQVSKQRIPLKLGPVASQPFLRPRIILAQAVPKGKNMEWIIQKAVELGVSVIQPLITRHTIVQPGDQKAEKWSRIALEACKQCGQDTLPIIEDPLPFDQWLEIQSPGQLKLIASLADDAKNFRETLQARPELQAITLAVGPEGDFSPEETQAALAAGFVPITLGNLVLRVETAAMFCLAAIRFQFI